MYTLHVWLCPWRACNRSYTLHKYGNTYLQFLFFEQCFLAFSPNQDRHNLMSRSPVHSIWHTVKFSTQRLMLFYTNYSTCNLSDLFKNDFPCLIYCSLMQIFVEVWDFIQCMNSPNKTKVTIYGFKFFKTRNEKIMCERDEEEIERIRDCQQFINVLL